LLEDGDQVQKATARADAEEEAEALEGGDQLLVRS